MKQLTKKQIILLHRILIVLKKSVSIVNEYLKKGKYSSELKKYAAIGIGFVDGDIEILYKKIENNFIHKIQICNSKIYPSQSDQPA